MRAHGLERMRRRGRRLAAFQTPAQRLAARKKGHATMKARGHTAEARAKIGKGNTSPNPVGTFAICRSCDLIYFSVGRWKSVYKMHRRCWEQFHRENPGGPGNHLSPPPPRKRGKQLVPEELARSWEFAVRMLLRAATIGHTLAASKRFAWPW
jgi:hypothetical protein